MHIFRPSLTPVKFQRNRSKTVGGVAYTRYLLLERGLKDGWKDEKPKRWGQKKETKHGQQVFDSLDETVEFAVETEALIQLLQSCLIWVYSFCKSVKRRLCGVKG